MRVFLDQTAISLTAKQLLGKGGEAEVYHYGNLAVKVFKPPNHSDYAHDRAEQEASRVRLAEHQQKLPSFPPKAAALTPAVVAPEVLARDQNGKIIGYTMPLIEDSEPFLMLTERSYRRRVRLDDITASLVNLGKIVEKLHAEQVVLGDLNDLNVLTKGTHLCWAVDCDSYQYAGFLCRTFTERFVDPLLCNSDLDLAKPYTEDSDWYAYSVIAFQTLLTVSPYGGIYKPKDPAKRVPQGRRVLGRITVFDQEVVYPKPAVPYDHLPDDLLQHFHAVFTRDTRGVFPLSLLQGLRWTRCANCKAEHARTLCPVCRPPAIPRRVATLPAHSSIVAHNVLSTTGRIAYACLQKGQLRWLIEDSGTVLREGGAKLPDGPGFVRARIWGTQTILAERGILRIYRPGETTERHTVDCFRGTPVFDATSQNYFWVGAGVLHRNGPFGGERILEGVANNTMFWTGDELGFGFYEAGALQVYFVFSPRRRGMNDSIRLPVRNAQLIDSTCICGSTQCWFLDSAQAGRRRVNRCFLVTAAGEVMATAEAEDSDGSWLGSLRGKCSVGTMLFCPTDDGIVRVEPNGPDLVVTRLFQGTEQWVTSASSLFPSSRGMYVVNADSIVELLI